MHLLFLYFLMLSQPTTAHRTAVSLAPAGIYVATPAHHQTVKVKKNVQRTKQKWRRFWDAVAYILVFLAQFVIIALLARLVFLLFPVLPVWVAVVIGLALFWGLFLLVFLVLSHKKGRE